MNTLSVAMNSLYGLAKVAAGLLAQRAGRCDTDHEPQINHYHQRAPHAFARPPRNRQGCQALPLNSAMHFHTHVESATPTLWHFHTHMHYFILYTEIMR